MEDLCEVVPGLILEFLRGAVTLLGLLKCFPSISIGLNKFDFFVVIFVIRALGTLLFLLR
jgi:hypothetical protein